MENISREKLLRVFRKRWDVVLLSSLLVGAVTLLVSALLPAQYETSFELLVIQNHNGKVDAFSAAKSAEYLSSILEKGLHSSSFYNTVLNSDEEIPKEAFGSNTEEIRKSWDKSVKSKIVQNTGIIRVAVYQSTLKKSQVLARKIIEQLSYNGAKYHGGGDSVEIKLIDGPVAEIDPVKPRVWLNTTVGLVFGAVVSTMFLCYVKMEHVSSSSLKIPKVQMPKVPDFVRLIPRKTQNQSIELNTKGEPVKNLAVEKLDFDTQYLRELAMLKQQ